VKTTKYLLVLTTFVLGVANTSPLQDSIEADYGYIDAMFLYFHANPELSMQEFNLDRFANSGCVAGHYYA
jgi:hypothetical protein